MAGGAAALSIGRSPASAPTELAAGGKPQRPNFLFLYTDDQRWDAMSVVQKEQGERARFPWFKTPNMDRLAAEGIRFRNAFVVNSLCSPSRACFLTSQYSHLNGVANNHTPFPVDNVTDATCLRAAGYTTGYFGKWHMDSQKGPRPGFDFSAGQIAHGRYMDCPFEVNGAPTPTKGWVDDVVTDYAIQFIKENKARSFSMVVGFKSPHDPRQPPERLQNLFAGEEPRPAENADCRPPYLPEAVGPTLQSGTKKARPGTNFENIRNYFRCIAGVDENIGRLLKALDEQGLADNTMVIYCSDNGYYLGEHSLGDKRSAYDESLRIPLLVRWPTLGAKGKVVDEMVLNIDLAPTLLDLAGAPIPPTMQGMSWRPLLEGRPAQWRKAFFYEYFLESGMQRTPTVLAVRTDAAKLIRYPGHDEWTELFDLKNDPFEKKNLTRDPAHKDLLEQTQAEFDRQAKAVKFRIPEYADKPGQEIKKGAKGK
jgi:arylsulfatase A-like enzyme